MDLGIVSFFKIPFLLALYFVPTLVARARMHPHFGSIVAVNLLTGWIGFGWIAALIWASIKPKADQ